MISERLPEAMPGWKFLSPPLGFGWAPDRHFMAVIGNGKIVEKVIIRHCWSTEGCRVEEFAYGQIAPHLPIRTPKLITTFETSADDTPWMILEDLGDASLDASCREDREAFLHVIGVLHAQGQALLKDNVAIARSCLPDHSTIEREARWPGLMRDGLANADLGLKDWMPDLLGGFLDRLSHQPVTILHGDTDYSNAIHTAEGEIALIDWEKACLGPAALDLGRMVETVEEEEEFSAYNEGLSQGDGSELEPTNLADLFRMAKLHNAFRWICYYIDAVDAGNAPPQDWRESYYDPSLRTLDELREGEL